MKKVSFVAIAAALAIAASSFSGIRNVEGFLYDDDGELKEVPTIITVPALCPESNVRQCQILIDGKLRNIFHPDGTPYMRN